jgi:hypothetical protein
MSLTEQQIAEYRRKLGDGVYMDRAVSGVAEKFLARPVPAEPAYAKPETNSTEENKMAKNRLRDLTDHLFEQIEWVKDRDIKGKELDEEIKRTEQVIKAAAQIVNVVNAATRAAQVANNPNGNMELPKMLEDMTK